MHYHVLHWEEYVRNQTLSSKGLLVVSQSYIIMTPLITILKGTEVTQMLMVCVVLASFSPKNCLLIIFLSNDNRRSLSLLQKNLQPGPRTSLYWSISLQQRHSFYRFLSCAKKRYTSKEWLLNYRYMKLAWKARWGNQTQEATGELGQFSLIWWRESIARLLYHFSYTRNYSCSPWKASRDYRHISSALATPSLLPVDVHPHFVKELLLILMTNP